MKECFHTILFMIGVYIVAAVLESIWHINFTGFVVGVMKVVILGF